MKDLLERIERALGKTITGSQPMPVGFGLHGLRAKLADGRTVAVKAASVQHHNGTILALEAYMLRELARLTDLPVPQVIHADDHLLVMSWIVNDGGAIGAGAQRHAAELLAAFHSAPAQPIHADAAYGYERDTLIGPLHQPNTPTGEWIPFFRDQRLMHMAHAVHDEGQLPSTMLHRLDRLADRLGSYLAEPNAPSLIHGDLWTGNVLVREGRIAGLIDPAIYIAHREIELAFTKMFGTFGSEFFDAYDALAPLEPGFHELRSDIYNLYPALVHVRLFGASYLGGIDKVLVRLGL